MTIYKMCPLEASKILDTLQGKTLCIAESY